MGQRISIFNSDWMTKDLFTSRHPCPLSWPISRELYFIISIIHEFKSLEHPTTAVLTNVPLLTNPSHRQTITFNYVQEWLCPTLSGWWLATEAFERWNKLGTARGLAVVISKIIHQVKSDHHHYYAAKFLSSVPYYYYYLHCCFCFCYCFYCARGIIWN